MNAELLDLRLDPASHAIDAGAITGLGAAPLVDMGAYEARPADTVAPTLPDDPITGLPLITPIQGVVVSTARPFFDWTSAQDNGQVVSYTLIITMETALNRLDGALTPITYQVNTTASHYTPDWGLPNGSYTWSVRAFDAAGNFSLWTPAQSFIVEIAHKLYLPVVR
jgi:hypothetical protein